MWSWHVCQTVCFGKLLKLSNPHFLCRTGVSDTVRCLFQSILMLQATKQNVHHFAFIPTFTFYSQTLIGDKEWHHGCHRHVVKIKVLCQLTVFNLCDSLIRYDCLSLSLVHESLGEAKTRDDISQNAWKYLKITLEELEEGSGEKGNYHGLFGLYHMAAIFLLCHAQGGKLKCCYQKENIECRESDK